MKRFIAALLLVLASADEVAALHACHKLAIDTQKAIGLAAMDEAALKEFFACDSGGLTAAVESGEAWFGERLPIETLDDYKLGAFNFNGFNGAFDTWRMGDGDLQQALRPIHEAYPDDDPFVLDYGYNGCFGPLAEFCLRALREFKSFHAGSRDAGGDRHSVSLGLNLSHDEAREGVSFWDVAAESLAGIVSAPLDFIGDLVGKPKSFCRAAKTRELQLAGDMVRTGILAYQELQAASRRIWAAQRAAIAAAGRVKFSPDEPVFDWQPPTAGDFEVEFYLKNNRLAATAYRIEVSRDMAGQEIRQRREIEKHHFFGPLVWAAEALRESAFKSVAVKAACRETRPDLNIREFDAEWVYKADIAKADPWLKLLRFYPAADQSADLDIPADARLRVVASEAAWRQLLRWDRLYALAYRAEAATIDAAFPPAARDELRLQRKLSFSTKHSAVLVVLRRAEIDLAKIMGQGIYRDSLSLRQLIANPKAVAAKALLESSPLRKLALCSPGPSRRMADPDLLRHDARSAIDELCELPHKLALDEQQAASLPEFLKIEGFVAVAFPTLGGGVRLARFQLPNTFAPNNPAAKIFTALAQAPAGLANGAELWPKGATPSRPEAHLATLAEPGAAAVTGPFQRQLWRLVSMSPAPVKTNGIYLAYGKGDEPLEVYLGQWLIPKSQALPAWPETLKVTGEPFEPVAGVDDSDSRFYRNRNNDHWAVVSVGEFSEKKTMFKSVTVMEFCRGGCS